MKSPHKIPTSQKCALSTSTAFTEQVDICVRAIAFAIRRKTGWFLLYLQGLLRFTVWHSLSHRFLRPVKLRQHFFFWKALFWVPKTGIFKNKCVEGAEVNTPTPSFFQAATRYTKPGNPFIRRSRRSWCYMFSLGQTTKQKMWICRKSCSKKSKLPIN